MAASTASQNRYYPSPEKAGALHDDMRLLFDNMYTLLDDRKSVRSELANLRKGGAGAAAGAGAQASTQAPTNGPSTTKILGLSVKAVPPAQGNQVTTLSGVPVLGYNAATGEYEHFILP